MSIDLSRAASFLAGHGRLLDRRRFELCVGRVGPEAVLAAVDGYRNDDGGYGWGLEPDLRAPESQPGGALYAFEVFEDVAHDQAVAAHPWLDRATRYCLDTIAALDSAPHAIALSFAIRFLDVAYERYPDAAPLLARLGRFVPATGLVPVSGGSDGETMRALHFASVPGTPARALLGAGVLEAELDGLAAQQRDDGGWTVDFASYSPAAALEWRGYATVGAVLTLKRAGRLPGC